MNAHYYSRRRLSPYRGTLHVIDAGALIACTDDGVHWRARRLREDSRLWPGRGWIDFHDVHDLGGAPELAAAFVERPALPFPPADHVELWLLNKESEMPLALLASRRDVAAVDAPGDCAFVSLPMEDRGFRAECLRGRDAARPARAWPLPHRDVLERQVNAAARPYAAAQWFVRQASGRGQGLGGPRVPDALRGRMLEPAVFPELLVDENWAGETERALVREYHGWVAARLLTHRALSKATRQRLEAGACRRPVELLEVFRLIPEFADRAALDLALVEARLMIDAPHASRA